MALGGCLCYSLGLGSVGVLKYFYAKTLGCLWGLGCCVLYGVHFCLSGWLQGFLGLSFLLVYGSGLYCAREFYYHHSQTKGTRRWVRHLRPRLLPWYRQYLRIHVEALLDQSLWWYLRTNS